MRSKKNIAAKSKKTKIPSSIKTLCKLAVIAALAGAATKAAAERKQEAERREKRKERYQEWEFEHSGIAADKEDKEDQQ